MSANRYLPHVLALPEDDANRDIVIGFRRNLAIDFRQVQVEDVAGGWHEVLDLFESIHAGEMDRHPNRRMVLLIDLDDDLGRLRSAKAEDSRAFERQSLHSWRAERARAAAGTSSEILRGHRSRSGQGLRKWGPMSRGAMSFSGITR